MEISTFGANLLTWLRINWTFLLVVGIMAAAFIFLRSSPSQINSLTQLNGLLGQGSTDHHRVLFQLLSHLPGG